jgi:hypothetical protein
MNIQEIKDFILPFIEGPIVNFEIEKTVFDDIEDSVKPIGTISKHSN